MTTRIERPRSGVMEFVAQPAVRAGAVLVVLWIGTAILLRGASEFGPMIAILTCASVMLAGTGAGTRFFLGQLVLWGALLVATAWLLESSTSRLPVVALFAAAAAWFIVVEPLLRGRRRPGG